MLPSIFDSMSPFFSDVTIMPETLHTNYSYVIVSDVSLEMIRTWKTCEMVGCFNLIILFIDDDYLMQTEYC